MTRILFILAATLGAAAIIWMGSDFLGSNVLALAITVVIGVVFAIGLTELVRFRSATASLEQALGNLDNSPPVSLDPWLSKLHPTLVASARLRLQGLRVGLPAPVLTPYLVGLLVMLGLLGTFAGMVETLDGAVLALQGSTELEAIRNGLAAPIQGLGMAFGTSVAGITASAMLGLNATLCRRERILATRELDRAGGTHFRAFSLSRQQQDTFAALRAQTEALPAVAGHLADISTQLAATNERLEKQMLEQQSQHLQAQQEQFTQLADSVTESLNVALADSGRMAGDSLRPVLEEAMAGIGESVQANQQLQLERQTLQVSTLDKQLGESSQKLSEQLISADRSRFEQWRSELETLHKNAAQRQTESQTLFSEELARLGNAMEEPMMRLIEAASEAPAAAAEVISALRAEIGANLERDNALLAERSSLLEQLSGLSGSLAQSTTGQRLAIEQMVSSSAQVLDDIGQRFTKQLSSQAQQITDISADVAGSASDMAGLGDAFSSGVEVYNQSNEKLMETLGRIETSLNDTTERSDEQMGYYVAQAREIIDQSMSSQRAIIEELREVGRQGDLLAAGAS